MKSNSKTDIFLDTIVREGTAVAYRKGQVLFSQGDPADAVFSILKGKVKLTVVSKQNKQVVIWRGSSCCRPTSARKARPRG